MENKQNKSMLVQGPLPPGGAITLMLTMMIGMILLGGCKPPALRSDKETDETNALRSGGERNPPMETISESGPGVPAALEPGTVLDDPAKKQFPLSRVITNSDGRSIPGEIVGKRGDEIAFKRTSDGRAFLLSLAQLSTNDQLELVTLADESVEAVVALRTEQIAAASPGQRSRRAEWHDDPEKAFAESKALGLPVYVLFTGSDWCPPCKILEKTIHDDFEFSEFADNNLVLLIVDFPKRKPQSTAVKERNQELATKWGVSSYPSIFLTNELDGSPETISRTRDVESFLSGVASVMARLSPDG